MSKPIHDPNDLTRIPAGAKPAHFTHTAGPWTASGQFVKADGRVIAEAFTFTRPETPYLPSTANARLIAAAPDLLAALRAIVAPLEGIRDDQSSPEFGRTSEQRAERRRVLAMYIADNAAKIDPALEQAAAAIAKAEGR